MSNLMIVALTMTIGYLLGRVKVKGLSLGTSGILLAALVLGHFGFVVSPDIKNIGLACFVTAVGIIAGPTFFENFKKGALQYIFLGVPDDRHRRCRVRCGDQDLGSAYAAGPGASQRRVNEYARPCGSIGGDRRPDRIGRLWYCLSVRSAWRRTLCAGAAHTTENGC